MANLMSKSSGRKTTQPTPKQQSGFGLVVFVAILGAIALSLVINPYSALLHEKKIGRESLNLKKVELVRNQVQSLYSRNLLSFDDSVMSAGTLKARLESEIPDRGLVQLVVGDPKVAPDGTPYRRIMIYLPSETEQVNPPTFATYKTTNVWSDCTNPSARCDPPIRLEFSSEDLQRQTYQLAFSRMSKAVSKVQSFNKARWKQDPEGSLVPNYFRVASNTCSMVEPGDIGCISNYTALVSSTYPAASAYVHDAVAKLQLSPDELISPWGTPLEITNEEDSEYRSPPYTMAMRYKAPNGVYLKMYAVQQS